MNLFGDPAGLPRPVTETAVRPHWTSLPATVQEWAQDQFGSAVVGSQSQRSGYTPGFASRILLADGRRLFVKIAGFGRDWLVESYGMEAAKRRTLPDTVPAPRLIADARARLDDQDWLLMIFDDVDGRPPRRPWTTDDVMAAVAAVEAAAQALTPAPAGFDWLPMSVEIGGLSPDKAETIDRDYAEHADELRELVAAAGELCTGDTLVHADLRDDNMIIDLGGRAWICDWTFPLLGKPFVDLATLLISVVGDGLDADRILARSPLVEPGDADAIDALLADLMLYYRIASQRPDPDSSPHLRAHQGHSGRVIGHWLATRRSWR